MIEFLRKIFKPTTSSATAKERLRLVLLSDHLSLAPEVIDALKRELIAVISHYVEVDERQVDVTFEQKDRAVAMLAEIPIISMKTSDNGKQAEALSAQTAATVPEARPMEPAEPGKKKPRRRRRRSRSTNAVTAV
ncbi:MAG: cell division topological specificity factor MinE [Candidatus Eremiobacteraeota bacterium]|nr:cell division topological specificity factor MinE [Candidatus Eremiobacteraeota bacterium]